MAEQRMPPGWEPVRSSAFTRVAYHRERGLYYKEFLPRSPLESLKAALRGSRAARARRNNEALLRADFDAPANVSWGRLPAGREYLFTRELPGRDITTWLRDTLAERSGPSLADRRSLLRELGAFIGRLHAAGFFHGDLRPGNVLAVQEETHWRFGLIDNESNRCRQPLPGRLLLKNLMQLNMLPPAVLSRADRMRFFQAWRRQMPEMSVLEAKILAAEAWLWAMRRMAVKRAT